MFDLLQARSRRFSRKPAPRAAAPAPLADDDEPVHGCGWFDSSHDLAHGTHVIELGDAVTPLWLPLCRKATLAQA